MNERLSTPGRNPWRTTSSRRVYSNPWISVREDRGVRADGSPGVYGVVSFATLALGVVPLLDGGETVLVGQHRYPLDEWSWEIPEGGGEPDRDAAEEAARELREETGLVAADLTDLGAVEPSNSVTDQRGRVFLATGCTQGPT